MEQEAKGFRDYLDSFRRRRKQLLWTMAVILALSISVAFGLPPVYRSTATILIEEQEIPPELVRSTVTSYADQRIQMISQRVMTRSNLRAIIDKFNLYQDERRYKTTEEVLELMQDDVNMDIVNAEVVDPRSQRPTQATIAFTLSYDSRSPQTAQRVANELVSLYLTENVKSRTEKAEETSDFLTQEAQRLRTKLDDLENKLAQFKERNVANLPELMQLNLQLMDRTERDLQNVETQIRTLEERKFYLQGQLAQIDPAAPLYSMGGDKLLDAESRLKVLQTQLISASATYAPDHPDVVRLKREIEALQRETGLKAPKLDQLDELASLQAELELARQKYEPEHPDVVRLERKVSALKEQIAQKETGASTDRSSDGKKPTASTAARALAEAKPDNPAYITLQAQLESTNSEQRALESQRQDLKAKLDDYEKRLTATPEAEREYAALTREHDATARRYQEISAKQMEAQVAQELERKSKGERFTLIDPPQLPELPVRPNRAAILFLGLVLSLGGGFGFTAVTENLDRSIRSTRTLVSLVGMPPLAVIPYIKTDREELQRKGRRKIYLAVTAAVVVVLLLLVHFLWKPLDVIWFAGLRRLGEIFGW